MALVRTSPASSSPFDTFDQTRQQQRCPTSQLRAQQPAQPFSSLVALSAWCGQPQHVGGSQQHRQHQQPAPFELSAAPPQPQPAPSAVAVQTTAAELIAALSSPADIGTPELGLLPSPGLLFNSPLVGSGPASILDGEFPWFRPPAESQDQHSAAHPNPCAQNQRMAAGGHEELDGNGPGQPEHRGPHFVVLRPGVLSPNRGHHRGCATGGAGPAVITPPAPPMPSLSGDGSGSDTPKPQGPHSSLQTTRSARDYRGPRDHPLDAKLKAMFSTEELRLNQKEWQELLRSRVLTAEELVRVKQLRRRSKCCVYSEGTRRKGRELLKAGAEKTAAGAVGRSQNSPGTAVSGTEVVVALQTEVLNLRSQLAEVTGLFAEQTARFDAIEAALLRIAPPPMTDSRG